MDSLISDFRYAARALWKNPAFYAIAVVCLSVGIATNTALFSCFNAIVLRPLPFPDPDRLAIVTDSNAKAGGTATVSYLTYRDWREQARSFSGMAATSGRSMVITEGEEPERLFATLASANLFSVIGVTPQLGRTFREDEDKTGAPGVVIISDALWRRRFGADQNVINRPISLNNLPYTIIGVMPPRFSFPDEAEMYVPLAPFFERTPRENRALQLWARVDSTATFDRANAELAAISTKLNAQYEPTSEWTAVAKPLRGEFVEPEVSQMVTTMFGAVTLVLLIACANVANLLLTRATSRQREMAVRAAIGAGRGRIVRQLLTESLMLAVVSGLLALPLTWFGLKLIDRAIPPENPMPWYFHWGLDVETLVYTASIAVITSVIFGLAPALQTSGGRLYDALKEGGGRGSVGSAKRNKLRSILVVAEVALSLILLVGASLFARTFIALQHADLGMATNNVATLRFYLPGTRYDSTGAINGAVRDVIDRVTAIPGVQAATASNSQPLGSCCSGTRLIVESARAERGREPSIDWVAAQGKWVDALGGKLLQGRNFTDVEVGSRSSVAVIDQRMADKFWPKGALGQRFRLLNDSATSFEVIGVVSNMRMRRLESSDQPRSIAYLPYMYLPARNNALMVRTAGGNPMAVISTVRQAIRSIDPTIAVFDVNSLDKVRTLSFWQYNLFYKMFGAFGAIALLLAGIGVYGVISYSVSQRTQEIGVRVALGARDRDVFGMVLREASWLAGLGVLFGVLGAFGVTRVLASFLIGVSPTDPLSFGSVSAFLTAVALLASYVPARRAMRVDPLVALRND